jgi:hypothetical protein
MQANSLLGYFLADKFNTTLNFFVLNILSRLKHHNLHHSTGKNLVERMLTLQGQPTHNQKKY